MAFILNTYIIHSFLLILK